MKNTNAKRLDKFEANAIDKEPFVIEHLEEGALERALKERIEDLALEFYGRPNRGSLPHDLRYGQKGGLSINADKGEWNDYSEGKGGGPFQLIAFYHELTIRQAVSWGRNWLKENPSAARRELRQESDAEKRENDAERVRKALEHWKKAKFDYGELKHYLKNRVGEWSLGRVKRIDDMRYAPTFWHTATSRNYPAMLCLLRDALSNDERAVQATYLVDDGTGSGFKNLRLKSEPEGKAKSQREFRGPPAGAVFKGFCPDVDVGETLCISEGIETALSLVVAGLKSVWATCGASGMAALPVIPRVKRLYIFADNDPKGEGLKAARACEARWREAGKEVRIVIPNETGHDFNDVLKQVLNAK